MKTTYLLLTVFLLSGCSKHTEYQLTGDGTAHEAVIELENILSMVQYKVKVSADENIIKLTFENKLNESQKELVSGIFSKAITGENPKPPIEFQVNIIDSRENVVNRILKENKNKKTYNISVMPETTPALFTSPYSRGDLAECHLKVSANSSLPILSYKLTEDDMKDFSEMEKSLMMESGIESINLKTQVLYPARLDLTFGGSLSIETTDINSQLGFPSNDNSKKTYLYYHASNIRISRYGGALSNTADSVYFSLCAIDLLKEIQPDIQNIFLTPHLSQWIQSHSSEDTLF